MARIRQLPFGWVQKNLVNIAPLQRGFDLPHSKIEKGDYPVVYSNGVLNYHSNYMVKSPGVVTGRSGTIGKVIFIEENFWPHNTSLWVTNFKSNYPLFIYYLYVFLRLDRFQTGSGVPTLNRNDVHAYEVIIPRGIKEQRAIATALSDTDELISSLDKLITKKRNIKKATMQQLLTGKKRLPGFSGEWEVKRLGHCFKFLKGRGLSKSKLSIDGEKECILYGELFTTYNEKITKVFSKTNCNEGVKSIYGDILMPGSTTTSGIDLAIASALMRNNILLGGDINILRPLNSDISSAFFAYYLTYSKKEEIVKKTQGITIIHLYGSRLSDIVIELPNEAEQAAIARILSEMDTEIEVLEQKRDKYKAIKQGMMQELLIGKTRLG